MSKIKLLKRNYDCANKNAIRERIIEIIKTYDIKSILTLESKDFLFSNLLPDKKIIVFERDKDIFKDMKKNKPKNVNLYKGEISEYSNLNGQVDCVYLDFCTNFKGAERTLQELKEVINKSKLFGVTLCLWDAYAKSYGDYQFALLSKLQQIFNLKVLYGKGYKDSMSMITILFEVKK
jgi:hypothetical protein